MPKASKAAKVVTEKDTNLLAGLSVIYFGSKDDPSVIRNAGYRQYTDEFKIQTVPAGVGLFRIHATSFQNRPHIRYNVIINGETYKVGDDDNLSAWIPVNKLLPGDHKIVIQPRPLSNKLKIVPPQGKGPPDFDTRFTVEFDVSNIPSPPSVSSASPSSLPPASASSLLSALIPISASSSPSSSALVVKPTSVKNSLSVVNPSDKLVTAAGITNTRFTVDYIATGGGGESAQHVVLSPKDVRCQFGESNDGVKYLNIVYNLDVSCRVLFLAILYKKNIYEVKVKKGQTSVRSVQSSNQKTDDFDSSVVVGLLVDDSNLTPILEFDAVNPTTKQIYARCAFKIITKSSIKSNAVILKSPTSSSLSASSLIPSKQQALAFAGMLFNVGWSLTKNTASAVVTGYNTLVEYNAELKRQRSIEWFNSFATLNTDIQNLPLSKVGGSDVYKGLGSLFNRYIKLVETSSDAAPDRVASALGYLQNMKAYLEERATVNVVYMTKGLNVIQQQVNQIIPPDWTTKNYDTIIANMKKLDAVIETPTEAQLKILIEMAEVTAASEAVNTRETLTSVIASNEIKRAAQIEADARAHVFTDQVKKLDGKRRATKNILGKKAWPDLEELSAEFFRLRSIQYHSLVGTSLDQPTSADMHDIEKTLKQLALDNTTEFIIQLNNTTEQLKKMNGSGWVVGSALKYLDQAAEESGFKSSEGLTNIAGLMNDPAIPNAKTEGVFKDAIKSAAAVIGEASRLDNIVLALNRDTDDSTILVANGFQTFFLSY